jgi:hypothetical protein
MIIHSNTEYADPEPRDQDLEEANQSTHDELMMDMEREEAWDAE